MALGTSPRSTVRRVVWWISGSGTAEDGVGGGNFLDARPLHVDGAVCGALAVDDGIGILFRLARRVGSSVVGIGVIAVRGLGGILAAQRQDQPAQALDRALHIGRRRIRLDERPLHHEDRR